MEFLRFFLFFCLIATIGATINSPMSVGGNGDQVVFKIKNQFLYNLISVLTGQKNIMDFLRSSRHIREVNVSESSNSRILPSSIAIDNTSLIMTYAPTVLSQLLHLSGRDVSEDTVRETLLHATETGRSFPLGMTTWQWGPTSGNFVTFASLISLIATTWTLIDKSKKNGEGIVKIKPDQFSNGIPSSTYGTAQSVPYPLSYESAPISSQYGSVPVPSYFPPKKMKGYKKPLFISASNYAPVPPAFTTQKATTTPEPTPVPTSTPPPTPLPVPVYFKPFSSHKNKGYKAQRPIPIYVPGPSYGYEPAPAYASAPAYVPAPTYALAPAYVPTPTYVPAPAYAPPTIIPTPTYGVPPPVYTQYNSAPRISCSSCESEDFYSSQPDPGPAYNIAPQSVSASIAHSQPTTQAPTPAYASTVTSTKASVYAPVSSSAPNATSPVSVNTPLSVPTTVSSTSKGTTSASFNAPVSVPATAPSSVLYASPSPASHDSRSKN